MNNNMLNSINSTFKKERTAIISTFLLGFLFYGIYLEDHYSVDTYVNLVLNDSHVNTYMLAGRFVTALYIYILKALNIQPANNQFVFYFISILLFSISAIITYLNLIKSNSNFSDKNKLLIYLGVICLFFHPYFTDIFVWSELSIIYPLSVCIAIVSGFIPFSKKRTPIQNFMITTILMIVVLGIYQASAVYFFISSLTVILNNFLSNNKIRETLKSILKIGFIYFISCIVQIAVLTLFKSTKANMDVNIILNLKSIIKAIPLLIINTHTFLPRFFFVSITSILLLFLLFFILKLSQKQRTINFIMIFVFIFIINVVIFAPHLLSSSLWIAPRTIVGLMAWPGIIAIWIAFITEKIPNSINVITKNNILSIICLMISILIFTNYFYTQKIEISTQVTNKIDRELTFIFYNEIQKYEASSGNMVKNIAFVDDVNVTWGYKDLITFSDTNVREFSVPYARISMFNFFSGRSFNEIPMDKDTYEKHFKNKDWKYYSVDQIVFKGDSAYIAVY